MCVRDLLHSGVFADFEHFHILSHSNVSRDCGIPRIQLKLTDFLVAIDYNDINRQLGYFSHSLEPMLVPARSYVHTRTYTPISAVRQYGSGISCSILNFGFIPAKVESASAQYIYLRVVLQYRGPDS